MFVIQKSLVVQTKYIDYSINWVKIVSTQNTNIFVVVEILHIKDKFYTNIYLVCVHTIFTHCVRKMDIDEIS